MRKQGIFVWNVLPSYFIGEDVLGVLERSNPWQGRQHDLIMAIEPLYSFEQLACLTFCRSWHHDEHSPFYSYLHTNGVALILKKETWSIKL